MRIACISEYFHLRLHLLKSADKCIYIIYTNSGASEGRFSTFTDGRPGTASQAASEDGTAVHRGRGWGG